MRRAYILGIVFSALLGLAIGAPLAYADYKLEEDFNGRQLDLDRWLPPDGNAIVCDGLLRLTPSDANWSGFSLTTAESFDIQNGVHVTFVFGKPEVAKNKGVAFEGWISPDNINPSVRWFEDGPEVDIQLHPNVVTDGKLESVIAYISSKPTGGFTANPGKGLWAGILSGWPESMRFFLTPTEFYVQYEGVDVLNDLDKPEGIVRDGTRVSGKHKVNFGGYKEFYLHFSGVNVEAGRGTLVVDKVALSPGE